MSINFVDKNQFSLYLEKEGRMRVGIMLAVFTLVETLNAITLDEIVKKMEEREKKLWEAKDVMTIMESGTVMPTGERMKIKTISYKKGKKFRIDMENPFTGKMIMLFDGKDYWTISAMGKMKTTSMQEQTQVIQTYSKYIKNGKLMGTETVEGRECYYIKITPTKDNPYLAMWVDKEWLYPIKAKIQSPQGEMIVIAKDFREEKGIGMVPHIIETQGAGISNITVIKEVKVNTGLSDDLFDPAKIEIK